MKRRRHSQSATPRAVALRYEADKKPAPEVLAIGRGHVAERIIELAREHDIPVHEDPELVMLLSQLDVGSVIPPELYPVVAELFAFLFRVNMRVQAERKRP